MSIRLRSLTTLLMLILAGVLLTRLFDDHEALGLVAEQDTGSAAGGASADAAVPALPTLAFPEREELTQLVERPPFSPTRRPPEDAAAPEPSVESASSIELELTLLGLTVSPNDRAALIRLAGSQAAQWVRLHDQVAGWRVTAIEIDRLILETKDRQSEFRLRRP